MVGEEDERRTMVNKFIVMYKANILLVILFYTCNCVYSQQGELSFIPDTAVNGIKLCNYKSAEKILGKEMWQNNFEEEGSYPRIEVINKNKSECLRLLFHYGGSKNSVDEFEIIKVDAGYKLPLKIISVPFDAFKTSRGVKLGLNKEEVQKILGKSFETKFSNGEEQMFWFIKNSNSAFLKRYNQYEYFIKCTFKDNKLIKYSFGFEYA